MNSSVRPGRILRAVTLLDDGDPVVAPAVPLASDEDVVVIGEAMRAHYQADSGLSTIRALVEAAERRAAEIIATAQSEAAAFVRQATASSDATRAQAFREGYEAGAAQGIQEGHAEIEQLVDLARAACRDGEAIRDQVAGSSTKLLADAVALAARRIAGEWYDADPAHTAAICAEALRAASGQEIISLRVNPSVAGQVQVALAASAKYVRADDSVEIGGCIIDVVGGTIDATLDSRLSLLELGLQRAAGGAQ